MSQSTTLMTFSGCFADHDLTQMKSSLLRKIGAVRSADIHDAILSFGNDVLIDVGDSVAAFKVAVSNTKAWPQD